MGDDIVRQHLRAAFVCELAAVAQLPVVLEEFGVSSDFASDDHAAQYYRQVLHTTLLAGGGIKGGITYGATDDFGFKAVEKPVHVHDLHATVLHCLGLDHTRLTYRYSGRDFRLTDVAGNVLHEILA